MTRQRFALAAWLFVGGLASVGAQQPPQARSPRADAPVDLAGYWVAIITEDWRWRMVTPPKGDFASIPLNAEGRRVMNAWDPATDPSCNAYGAGGLLRMPLRLRIGWESDTTLKIETDAGQQTRLLQFGAAPARPGPRSLQGYSSAAWDMPPAGRGGAPRPRWGSLRVVTTNLRAAWLRRNGVPYSEDTVVTEYFDRHSEGDAGEWLTVTTTVEDPRYLTQPFITSSSFRREPDGSRWSPTPCKAG